MTDAPQITIIPAQPGLCVQYDFEQEVRDMPEPVDRDLVARLMDRPNQRELIVGWMIVTYPDIGAGIPVDGWPLVLRDGRVDNRLPGINYTVVPVSAGHEPPVIPPRCTDGITLAGYDPPPPF